MSMRNRTSFIAVCMLLACPLYGQVTRYVDQTASGTADGQTWANAYTDLQAALADSALITNGGDVLIAEGSYIPHPSDPDVSFVLFNDLALKGGYQAGGTGVRDPQTHATFLDGNLGMTNSKNVVTIPSTMTTSVELNGLTIQRGRGAQGGGVLITVPSSASIEISGCSLFNNSATLAGGAISATRSSGGGFPSLTISSTDLRFNVAGVGGAIVCLDFALTIQEGSSVCTNIADDAGAIEISGGTLDATDTVFSENNATGSGGAILIGDTAATFTDCDFLFNASEGFGGGVSGNSSLGSLVFDRCIFENNSSALQGGAINSQQTVTINASQFDTNRVFVPDGSPSTSLSFGGALNLGGAVTIADSCFQDNIAEGTPNGTPPDPRGLGGAVHIVSDDYSIVDCRFITNTADEGGALYVVGGTCLSCTQLIDRCDFEQNDADFGGGIRTATPLGSGLDIANSRFVGNSASVGGGLLIGPPDGNPLPTFLSGIVRVTNCTLADNFASIASQGGGIYMEDTDPAFACNACTVEVRNSILWMNRSGASTNAEFDNLRFVSMSGTSLFSHNNIGGCTGSLSVPCSGASTSDSDPLFYYTAAIPWNVRLDVNSPHIGAGNNTFAAAFVMDLDNEPRIGGSGMPPIVDLGAYEFKCPADFTTTGTNSGDPGFGVPDGVTNVSDFLFFVDVWTADQGNTPGSLADLSTTGAANDDCEYGVPDGVVDGSDLLFFGGSFSGAYRLCQ